MKKCPYCAEEIQDKAIKCRWCGTMLTDQSPPQTSQPLNAASPGGPEEALEYTHSGRRYVLGYGRDFFGIWDRQQPGSPIAKFPRTDDGWRQAWIRFAAEEPYNTNVAAGTGSGGAKLPGQPAGWSRGVSGPASGYGADYGESRRAVSGAWWLLVIFLGWIGGLIAWLVNKDIDPERARAMLITGIVISVVSYLLLAVSLSSSRP